MTFPDANDKSAWVETLRRIAGENGATNVAISFDFGDHTATYAADAPSEDDGE